MELELLVTNKEELKTRIIRASTATIELPELGVKIEPGMASDAFVSNVEGVINRASAVIQQVMKSTENENKKQKAKQLLEKVEKIKEGEDKVTIKIKDPRGNSAIVSNKTKKRKLTQNEIDSLKTGMMVFEIDHEIISKAGEKKNTN